MGQVVKFSGDMSRALQTDASDFLVGYAAAACDIYRAGAQDYAEEAIKESGLQMDDFEVAGVEEYDLETLREIYDAIGH